MKSAKILVIIGAVAALCAYAWTTTPSYTVYGVRHAIGAHDYVAFTRYVDVNSVIEHALQELGHIPNPDQAPDNAWPNDLLGRILRQTPLAELSRTARAIMKAGVEIAVEQAIQQRDRPLPAIPLIAVVAALWQGERRGDLLGLPIEVKGGEQIEVIMRKSPTGLWRVVEVSNLSAVVPELLGSR